MWTIVNVKTIFKGQCTCLDNAYPIYSISDLNIEWLRQLASILKAWNANKKINNCIGFLSNETYIVDTYYLNYYFINRLLFKFYKFLLLGKFQTDELESR